MTTELTKEFLHHHTWAVVGVSSDHNKYGYKVYTQLKKAGYTVYPVNPKLKEIEGFTCFPDLRSLPETPEVVNVVVPPSVTEQIAEQCAVLGISRIWMQPGAESPNAVRLAEEHQIKVVHHHCVLIETQNKIM